MMRNRLREIRESRNVSVKELAKRAGTTASKIYKLEDGSQRLNDAWLARLAPALDVAPGDLISTGPLSVPLVWNVAAAIGGDDVAWRAGVPEERIYPPRSVFRAENCIAVQVLDDSADRIPYPPGTILIVRPLEHLATPLHIGQKVVVQRFRSTVAAGETLEVLAGFLDRDVTGELIVTTASFNRSVPAAVRLKAAPLSTGFSERQISYRSNDDADIPYVAEPGDPARIVGVIVMAMKIES